MRLSGGNRGWRLVVPVRDPRTGKSRLGEGPELNLAIAYDTVSAALGCPEVEELLLVTDAQWWIGPDLLDAEKLNVLTDRGAGLNPAVTAALHQVGPHPAGLHQGPAPVAVMLGDLPCLRPDDLSRALHAAAHLPSGMVTDRQGTGTTLLTGPTRGVQFGPDSAQRHRQSGYRELELALESTVRRDLDTPEDLFVALREGGLGPHTRRALDQSAPALTQPRSSGLQVPLGSQTAEEVAYA